MTDPDILTKQISEKELQQCVMDTARLFGWLAYHPWRSDHSAAGYPDTTLVRARAGEPPRLLFAELKSERGRLSASQREWIAALERVEATAMAMGWPLLIEVFVWRPSDWHSGAIEKALR